MGIWKLKEFKDPVNCFSELGLGFFAILWSRNHKSVLSTSECPSPSVPAYCTETQMAKMHAICCFLVHLCLHKACFRIFSPSV